ncbi:efflux RND transporter periplasmic adaptor subunit [Sulfuriflexus mobilis]|uniref:efflux RND transporter periplasmic adaptor subunit n=1 Tax=Sulfuriflexus mobilis TaxID=1811807 RepID=UPI000F8280CF|nr:efflux RND transporter periplasmic adaptor subunit [Sulfuriflexus mobilis]
MKLPHHTGLIGTIVAIIVGLVIGFWPQPSWVEVARVSRAPLLVTVVEEGKTRVIDRYIISAPVTGVACRVDMNVGDNVTQGQVLLGLDPMQSEVLDPRRREEAKARVAAAASALRAAEENARAAKADADYAATELTRIKKLFETGHVSHDVMDKANTAAHSTSAAQRSTNFAVDVARYDLAAAKTALKYSAAQEIDAAEKVPIRAPVTGQILKIHHECKGVVTAGQPILEVGDTSQLEVEIEVLSEDAVSIIPGMRVLFHRWGKNQQPLEGRVRTIEPVGFTKVSALGVEEQRVLIIADITSPYEQWSRLGDGYRVEAQFILWEEKNVLQIPASALFHYQDAWAVFVLENGRAYRRVIKIGQRNGLVAQVFDGLTMEEKVILYPDDTISNGKRVKVRTYN